jgi:hypothetical protein
MGGPGSGNHCQWWRGTKKAVVEDCLALDIGLLKRRGALRVGASSEDSVRWARGLGQASVVAYETTVPDAAGGVLQLRYTVTPWLTNTPEEYDYAVRLTATRPHFGRLRWWFVCPLAQRGGACNRLVGKLYLPPGRRYFGCRCCHNLTYRSAQQHDKRVDALRGNPTALEALLDGRDDFRGLLLVIKATGKMIQDLGRLAKQA